MNPPPPGPVSGLSATKDVNAGGDAGVDRVSALGEHARARLGGELVAGRDRASHAAERK